MTNPLTAPTLDPTICEQLTFLEQSSPGLLARLVNSFLSRYDRVIADAQTPEAADDLAGLRSMAHSLKGSSSSLGATALAALAGEIEQRALSGDAEACRRLLPQLPGVFHTAAQALRAWAPT